MVDFNALVEFEQGELSPSRTLALFSSLVESGDAWRLQGAYGRQARRFIDAGFLDTDGRILKDIDDEDDADIEEEDDLYNPRLLKRHPHAA